MPIYTEGLIGYLFALDAVVYGVMTFTKGWIHHESSHWLSAYIPFEKSFAMLYVILTSWVLFLLFRMQLLQFWR